MRGISNWCGENFIGWWAADFQIYVLRESCSAKASTIPGFHLHCLEGNRSTYIWKSACSTVSNDFLDVLESAGRELMETQIILTCAVPLILYASVNLLTFFLGRWCHNLILSSNAKIPPHQISFPMRWFLFLLHCFYRSRHFFFISF